MKKQVDLMRENIMFTVSCGFTDGSPVMVGGGLTPYALTGAVDAVQNYVDGFMQDAPDFWVLEELHDFDSVRSERLFHAPSLEDVASFMEDAGEVAL